MSVKTCTCRDGPTDGSCRAVEVKDAKSTDGEEGGRRGEGQEEGRRLDGGAIQTPLKRGGMG